MKPYDPDDYTDDLGGAREHNNREATVGWRDRLAVALQARDERHDRYECANGHPWMPDTTRYVTDRRGKQVKVCIVCRNNQETRNPQKPRFRRTSSW